MKTTYKISFNQIETCHQFESDDEAFNYCNHLSDDHTIPYIQKEIDQVWHFWSTVGQEWIPNGSTYVSAVVVIHGWMPPENYTTPSSLKQGEKPHIKIHGLHPLMGLETAVGEVNIHHVVNL